MRKLSHNQSILIGNSRVGSNPTHLANHSHNDYPVQNGRRVDDGTTSADPSGAVAGVEDDDDDSIKKSFSLMVKHRKQPYAVRSTRDSRFIGGWVWKPSRDAFVDTMLVMDKKIRDDVALPALKELGARALKEHAKELVKFSLPEPEGKVHATSRINSLLNIDRIVEIWVEENAKKKKAEMMLSTLTNLNQESSVSISDTDVRPLTGLRLSLYKNRKAVNFEDWNFDKSSFWCGRRGKAWFPDEVFYVSYQTYRNRDSLHLDEVNHDNFFDDRAWFRRSRFVRFVHFDASKTRWRAQLLPSKRKKKYKNSTFTFSLRAENAEQHDEDLHTIRAIFSWLEESAKQAMALDVFMHHIVGFGSFRSIYRSEKRYYTALLTMSEHRTIVYAETNSDAPEYTEKDDIENVLVEIGTNFVEEDFSEATSVEDESVDGETGIASRSEQGMSDSELFPTSRNVEKNRVKKEGKGVSFYMG